MYKHDTWKKLGQIEHEGQEEQHDESDQIEQVQTHRTNSSRRTRGTHRTSKHTMPNHALWTNITNCANKTHITQ